MTHARPNALSLAVAVAISSSAIGAQALADRRLQIKSIDIQGNGHTEFTQSEVVVQPTLGHDQQPIPKSYTTTYPDQAEARAGYEVPSEGFTDVLSGISGGVSSVDQFETDDYGVAQKYTKVLKVGNEGVFKFTHYLADNKLLIEVRGGMTHQDSIDAVRGQSSGIQRLEPLTKIASPEQLVALLKGADGRTGSLGEVDHYVPLATLEVDEVIVNGRTFMRLIACGDQPPALQHLGQSLFVNDEALLAAATSAYTQVHVLGEGIQQKALNDLLSYHKPVGYVVHIEDVAQPYPVPEGYPKMELIQATGEVIVFRSQKQNPTDIAFVEGLYDLWGEFDGNDRASEATAQLIKKDKVKSYQHVIRSRQMALLETLAAEHNANEQTIAAFEDKLVTLAFYESLQQALTSASSDGADEFEFTIPHIRAASSFITPTWMHMQLAKHFVFKPTLRNLLANRYFFQNIQKVIPIAAEVTGDPFAEDERFASKLMGDITGQLFEMESKLEKLQVKEAELAEISKTAHETRAMATQCIKENHRAVHLNQLQEAEVKRLRQDLADLKNTKTPNRPKARPEVLETLRAVERALDETSLSEKDDVYLHRMYISYYLRIHITEARRPKEEALVILQSLERLFNIKIDEGGDKAARLERIRKRLDGGNISSYELDKMDEILWEDHSTDLEDLEGRDIRLNSIRARLAFKVEESEQRAREQQAAYLIAVEDELNIYPHERTAAKERGKTFIAKLASDLQVKFENSASLSYLKHALIARIEALREEANEICDDEGVQRIKNNEIAHQLNIEDYRDDASADEQNSLIKEKLKQLNEQVFKAGQPDVNERIAGIENELDRHMARLGPKPRFVLDLEITMAKQTLEQARAELAVVYRKLNAIQGKRPLVVVHNKYPVREGDGKALNQAVQLTPGALGQPAGDEQTPESRVDAVRQMPLQGSEERRDPVIDKLEAAFKKMNIRIRRGDIGLLKKADYIAISASANTDNRVETDTIDNEPGELLLTRIKYRHVAEFLHEHDKKSTELTNARLEERNAQENLDRKKQEIKDPGDIDEQAKTAHNKEIAALTLALKQKTEAVLKAKDALTDYHEAGLDASEEAIGLKPDTSDAHEQRINTLRKRQVELGGYDGTGGTIQQLIKKQARLEDEIKTREADIEKMNEVLKAAEEAAEHDGGPFQFTPKQEKARADIHKFVQQHPLKKQALEAALGLTEAAAESGKATPFLTTFDFDDEFAPIRLKTMVGDNLSFDQASRIVEVFKNLKRHFPVIPHEPPEDQSQNVLTTIEKLVFRARHQMKTGAQQYDDEIHGMGLTAVHYVEHEPSDLKGFSEYFTTRSASGKKIIALLREGVISKLELENYIRAVRGVDGYQTVDEFAHFLGYKHAVKVPEFRKVVQMLSDEGAEQFMRIAFTPVTVTATGPAGMTESVTGMKEYAAAVIANYVLDDIAFENGRKTAAFLTNVQDTLTPYAHAAGISESELIQAIHGTLMQAHAAAVERQLYDYWIKPSAFLAQAVTWYYSSYKPLLVTLTAMEAVDISLSNMAYLYLLDLTNRGDYTHRMLTPFQHWLERYGVDLDRTSQYAYHREIEKISALGGLVMPLGKAASSVILLKTGSLLFARQYNANPHRYRSIFRLIPEIVKSMGSGQGIQIPLLHRITPEKVKTLVSATAGLVLGPVATIGAYAYGLVSGFTYAQTFGFALASSLTFDFFMNDNKMLTQWLGGPLGRSLDKFNRWRGEGETETDYLERIAIATPQRFSETDEEYANRVKANNVMHGWTRDEHYLQFRERRDRSMKMYEHGWEKYFRDNVPQWSFSHAESIPYFYTLSAFFEWQESSDQKLSGHDREMPPTGDNRDISDEL